MSAQSTSQPVDDIPLPIFSLPKERDYAPYLERAPSAHWRQIHGASDNERGEYSDTVSSDTTATNSSDEFNWDEDDGGPTDGALETKAKRGRAIYLMFMRLSRPFRVYWSTLIAEKWTDTYNKKVILVGLIGAAIFVAPLLVVQLKFEGNLISRQVHVWSLWLSITWAASCVTYLLVDAVPRLIIYVIVLFAGHVEQLKTQLEVCAAISLYSSKPLLMCLVQYSCIWLLMDG